MIKGSNQEEEDITIVIIGVAVQLLRHVWLFVTPWTAPNIGAPKYIQQILTVLREKWTVTQLYIYTPLVLVLKNLPVIAGDIRDAGSIPESGRYLGGEHGNPSSILAWRIPWSEETDGPQSIGLQRVRNYWSNLARTHAHQWIHHPDIKLVRKHWLWKTHQSQWT